MSKISAFPYTLIAGSTRKVLLWLDGGNGRDRFFTSSEGRILLCDSLLEVLLSVRSKPDLHVYCDTPDEMDLEQFKTELKALKPDSPVSASHCKRLLNGWNFLDDVAYTLGISDHVSGRDNEQLNALYQKVFAGCNLPAVTLEPYQAKFRVSEIRLMQGAFTKLQAAICERDPRILAS